MGAHNASGIEEAVVDQCLLDAVLITLPVTAEAVAHGRPSATDARTAAAEEKVVVQLILLYRRSPADVRNGRALDRKRDGAVVLRRKNVAAEAIVVWFPPDRHALHPAERHQPPLSPHVQDKRPTHNVPLVRQIVPPAGTGREIGVVRHLCEQQERLALRHVRPEHVVFLPV